MLYKIQGSMDGRNWFDLVAQRTTTSRDAKGQSNDRFFFAKGELYALDKMTSPKEVKYVRTYLYKGTRFKSKKREWVCMKKQLFNVKKKEKKFWKVSFGDGLSTLPPSMEMRHSRDSDSNISTENGVVTVDLPEKSSVSFWTKKDLPNLEKGKKYVFKVEFKVDGVSYDKAIKNTLLLIMIHTGKKIGTAMVIGGKGGKGGTGGWVTAVIPFDTGKNPEMVNSKFWLRVLAVKGKFQFRNPQLEELHDNSTMKRHFILPSGGIRRVHYLMLK